MTRRFYAVPAIAVTVTAGVLAPPAMSGPSVSAGVARARAAGIHVSAAAARMMAEAPKGSCMADPTRRGCPKVKRIVAAPRGAARIATATGCRVEATYPGMDSSTSAYGTAYSVSCGSNTVYNEIITTLQRYTDQRTWQQMDTAIRSTYSSHTVGATARFTHCSLARTPVYDFRTKGYSYSKNRSGTAYTATLYKEKLLACRPT